MTVSTGGAAPSNPRNTDGHGHGARVKAEQTSRKETGSRAFGFLARGSFLQGKQSTEVGSVHVIAVCQEKS